MAQEPEDDLEGDSEADFEAPSGGGGKKKLLLFVGLPLLLVIGGGAAAYFTGLADPIVAMITGKKPADASADAGDAGKDKGAASKDAGKDAGKKKEGKPGEAGKPGAEADASGATFYDLPEMLVNINTAGHKRNFLKLRITLEVNTEADINTVEVLLPRIIDSFQVYLRELRLEDLQGAAGMYRLRAELLMRVNAALSPVQVKDVLFKEMIVQ